MEVYSSEEKKNEIKVLQSMRTVEKEEGQGGKIISLQ